MHKMISKLYLPLLICAFGCLGACRHNSRPDISELEKCDSIPLSIKKLVRAVADDDSVAFASLVSYPLLRPYPLHNIDTPEQMVSYYSVMVDDSLRSVLTSSRPGDWEEYGWRGWSLKRGEYVWVDADLYAVNYLSAREKVMLDSLIAADMGSLHRELAEGWVPELCLQTHRDGGVMRIDTRKDSWISPPYRLLIYPAGSNLRETPAYTLNGYRDSEGTAGNTFYKFGTPSGREVLVYPYMPDGSTPIVEFPDTIVSVNHAYWLDLINF